MIPAVYPKYVLENASEIDRLTINHTIFKDALKGELIQVPIDRTKAVRVLDIATADGLWLRDVASTLPLESELIGIDDSPSLFPPANTLPKNLLLIEHNINTPFPVKWANYFDLVHIRLGLAGLKGDITFPIMRACNLVKPGGWIQIHEAENGSIEGRAPVLEAFISLQREVFSAMGADPYYSRKIPSWVKAVGFVNVHEEITQFWIGKGHPNKELGEKGALATALATKGLAKTATNITKPLTMSKEEIAGLPSRVEKELSEQGGVYPMRLVWGQRPEPNR